MTKGWKKTVDKPKGNRFVRLALLFALCVVAGILLWHNGYFTGDALSPAPGAQPPAQAKTPTTLRETNRTTREIAYDKDIATLRELTQNQGLDAQTRADAAQQLEKRIAAHDIELGIEAALEAAGFAPCLVLFQNGALTVMVEAEELSGAESTTILSLCAAHGDVGLENIRIMAGTKHYSGT